MGDKFLKIIKVISVICTIIIQAFNLKKLVKPNVVAA